MKSFTYHHTFYPIRQYYRIKQDDEMTVPPDRATGLNSWPMTMRLENFEKIPRTDEWVKYWKWLNGNDEEAYFNYSRKFEPAGYLGSFVMGLNVISGVEMILPERVGTLLVGTPVLKVRTLHEPDYSVTYESDPDIIQVANIIYADRYASNGLKRVDAFPDMGGRGGQPVYFPVVSRHDVYYALDNLVKLPFSAPPPSPYNPP